MIRGAHHPVHQAAIVGHENQTFRILVQTSDGVNPGGIAHIIYDVTLLPLVRGADDAGGLVHRQQNLLLFLPAQDRIALTADHIALQDFSGQDFPRCQRLHIFLKESL